ncbi:hypothetical protein [Actinospica robiniae]|uniref:hypothetical protein n=1 Tax=Actinospica robiniae TaxID=304901 RepID=UPI000424EF97|nr:hypothetical protein [Actinospica robiniae]
MGTSEAAKAAPGDPWAVPTQRGGVPKAGVPRKRTPQQAARLERQQQTQARAAAKITWPIAFRLILAQVACRLVLAGVLIFFGFENMHLHALLVSPTTTRDQWNAAIHTSNSFAALGFLSVIALCAPGLIWNRVRLYVAKLPGVAPHPMQSTNASFRTMGIPAYWPPVPKGTPSWTRRIHWRVPPSVTATLSLLLAVTNRLDHGVIKEAVSRYQLSSVVDLIGAVLALVIAFFDVTRLREYSRWPGRP